MCPTVAEIQSEFDDGERHPVDDADHYDTDGYTLTFVHKGSDGTVTRVFTLEETKVLQND